MNLRLLLPCSVVTAAIVSIVVPPAGAQSTGGTPPETIARFSYTAPPLQTVTLTEWDGLLRPDKVRIYVPGPVFVDWNRLKLVWWFKGTALAQGIGPVRWEISQYPFPEGTFTPTPGFDLVGEAPSLEFFVDLNPLAPRPPNWTQQLAVKGPVGVMTLGAKFPGITTEVTGPPQKKIIPTNPRFPGSHIPLSAKAPIQAYVKTSQPVLAQSMSLYARVIPLDAPGGNPIGPPSNTVVLNFGQPDVTGGIQVKFVHPDVSLVGYTPMRPYDFNYRCYAIAGQDLPLGFGSYIPKGTPLDLCHHDSDLLSDIISTIGDFFEMMVDFVNWVSSAYDTVKSTVAATVSGALTGLGVPCNEQCVGFGINMALAATGMPPDIPDFEQLQAMGEGYVVDTLADYATSHTGVPVPEAAKDAIKQQVHDMIEQGAESLKDGGPNSTMKYIPDLRYQFHGPIVTMDLTNPDPTYWSMTTTLTLEDTTGRYATKTFSTPAIKPGGTTRIALTLVPNQDPKAWMDKLPDDNDVFGEWAGKIFAALEALDTWKATYQDAPLVLHAKVGVYEGFTKTCDAAGSNAQCY